MTEFLGPALTASGVIGLFTAATVLVMQLFRQNTQLAHERDSQIRDLKTDVKELKNENLSQRAENFACRMQVNGLCNILRSNGQPIPDWIFRDGENEKA